MCPKMQWKPDLLSIQHYKAIWKPNGIHAVKWTSYKCVRQMNSQLLAVWRTRPQKLNEVHPSSHHRNCSESFLNHIIYIKNTFPSKYSLSLKKSSFQKCFRNENPLKQLVGCYPKMAHWSVHKVVRKQHLCHRFGIISTDLKWISNKSQFNRSCHVK